MRSPRKHVKFGTALWWTLFILPVVAMAAIVLKGAAASIEDGADEPDRYAARTAGPALPAPESQPTAHLRNPALVTLSLPLELAGNGSDPQLEMGRSPLKELDEALAGFRDAVEEVSDKLEEDAVGREGGTNRGGPAFNAAASDGLMRVAMNAPGVAAASARPAARNLNYKFAADTAGALQSLMTQLVLAQEPAVEEAVDATEVSVEESLGSGLVNNFYFDTDLREALSDIGDQTGAVIIPDAQVQGFITLTLTDVPLEKALELVLAGTGYVVKRFPDYILVISPEPSSPSFGLISETRVVHLAHMPAESALSLLAEGFQTFVRAEAEANLLAITAPPAQMDRILADIALFDRPPRQVLLEVQVVVIENDDMSNLGIQWQFPQLLAGTFTNSDLDGTWPWGVRVGLTPGGEFSNALALTLNLLEQNDEGSVVANPQIVAQDGREALISVRTEEFFEIITQGFVINSQLEQIDTGTLLKITPRIGPDGYITLDLHIEVSNVTARGENNLPVVTRRIVENRVRVADGGTAVVAGLMDNRRRLTSERVPGLHRVPGFGRIFRNDLNQGQNRQVAVFVTPHVLYDQGELPPEALAAREVPAQIQLVGSEFREELQTSLNNAGRN